MLDVVIGIPLGVIGALVVFIWMTMPTNGAEPLALPEHSPEKLDEQWRAIWNNGLDPVWNDHFGWMADGPSVVDKLRSVQQGPVTQKFEAMIQKNGAVRVIDVSAQGSASLKVSPRALQTMYTENLQALLDDLIAQFDHLVSLPGMTCEVINRAQMIARDVNEIRAELDRRHLVQRDATGTTVIDDYPQIGYL